MQIFSSAKNFIDSIYYKVRHIQQKCLKLRPLKLLQEVKFCATIEGMIKHSGSLSSLTPSEKMQNYDEKHQEEGLVRDDEIESDI